ncbi:MAG: phenylalanine--tRNA ligase subunit beta [Myxococcales bacterium]
MRISVNWLRELCPTDLDVPEIARRLTLAGFEVEAIEQRTLPDGIVSAKIVSAEKVPGSDHLSVTRVDDGTGTHQVVCGAQNFQVGDVVPMARPGTTLPGGMRIERAKLRGIESSGMLCSGRELGLSEDHSGLLLLPRETPVGVDIGKLLGLPDTVFEINVTPNRPDALSHFGTARELSALTGTPARLPPSSLDDSGEHVIDAAARVDVEDAERCPRYVARVIEGVRIGPSPLALQERLRGCGVRPISNVVDATNLVLLELGHPLHAFDLEKLTGARIIVRRARKGEPMTTLDGKERTLSEDDLVIADAERPVALAGVMGGATSEVSDRTTRILLESAVFDPPGVRRTARRHGLHTEASHRFERGADEQAARVAADRCAELIVKLAGGKVLPGAIDRYPSPRPLAKIWVRPARISAVLGTQVDAAEVEKRLLSLGLEPLDGNPTRRLWCAPSWRRDLTREIDCVEEIARLRGFDTIPIEVPKAGVGETAAILPQRRVTAAARAALAARGFDEALNYSFVAERELAALIPQEKPILVANPLTVEQGAMRTTLVAGLLRNVGHALKHGAQDARLYELGRVYRARPSGAYPSGELAWPADEPRRLALVGAGHRAPRSWAAPHEPVDFYDLKGAVEDVLRAMAIEGARFVPAERPWLHPAASAEVVVGGTTCGALGQIHPRVAQAFDVPVGIVAAELEWELLLAGSRALRQMGGVPRFPAVARDLAFVVGATTPAEEMLREIRSADEKGLIEDITLFDVYRGAQVPEGKKSVAYGLTLRATDRTLTDAEADALCTAVKDRLKGRLGAEIRA